MAGVTTTSITDIINSAFIEDLSVGYAVDGRVANQSFIESPEQRVYNALRLGCKRLARRATRWMSVLIDWSGDIDAIDFEGERNEPIWMITTSGRTWSLYSAPGFEVWYPDEMRADWTLIERGERDTVLAAVPDHMFADAVHACIA